MGKCIPTVLSQLQSPPAEDAVNANISWMARQATPRVSAAAAVVLLQSF